MPAPTRAGVPGLPPMHRTLRAAVEEQLGDKVIPQDANPSLVWERFPRVWSRGEIANAKERQDFLRRFVDEYATLSGNGQIRLGRALQRLEGLSAPEKPRDFDLVSPFVTGLGNEHPTENGFTFDRLIGTPMLPGTSLKGLARAAARLLGEEHLAARLLGSDISEQGETAPGNVVFLGGWPTRWPKIKLELINPHHPTYQQDQGKPLPPLSGERDRRYRQQIAHYTEEPVPVTFLAVAPGASFRIFLAHTGRRSTDFERVWGWLALGLDLLGVGGKTASGFGRFRPREWTPRVSETPQPRSIEATPTLLILLEAPIGGRAVSINEDEILTASPPRLLVGAPIRAALTDQEGDPTWWTRVQQEVGRVAKTLSERLREQSPRPTVTIGALAPMPALIALGWAIGDMVQAEAILKRRDYPWGWAEDSPDDPVLELRPPADMTGTPALLVNISGENRESELPAPPLGGRWSIWELRIDVPRLEAIRSRRQRDTFRRLARQALTSAAAVARGQDIHLFPAMPAALAVELGRLYLPKGWPPLSIWDRSTGAGGWTGPRRLVGPL